MNGFQYDRQLSESFAGPVVFLDKYPAKYYVPFVKSLSCREHIGEDVYAGISTYFISEKLAS